MITRYFLKEINPVLCETLRGLITHLLAPGSGLEFLSCQGGGGEAAQVTCGGAGLHLPPGPPLPELSPSYDLAGPCPSTKLS